MNKLRPLIASLCLLALACTRTLPVEEQEKAMLLRAGDLVRYGYGLAATEKYESFTKTRLFDGSYEIEYEFETPESETENALYLYVQVTVERQASNTLLTQGAERLGVRYGLRKGGVKEREIKDFYRYGDASAFYILEKDGEPIGNLFTVREGGKLYTLLLSGFYFDDPQVWGKVLGPKLSQFSRYQPS